MPTFACPTCNKPVEWSAASKWRPFCSERCRLIDLGAWISEQHVIPTDAPLDGSGDTGTAAPTDRDEPPRH